MKSKTKHPFVIFVGDRPSGKNRHKTTPFVGTTSYKKLLEWMHYLDLDFRWCDMVNASDDFINSDEIVDQINAGINNHDIKIVALGRNAERYLKQKHVTEVIVLPHPSGKNYLLNDKTYIKKILNQVKKSIHDE